MPFIRFLVSKYYTYIIAIIFLLSEIMPFCSCCEKKKLVYIIIAAPFSYQPSLYMKCTKLNIYLFCNIRLISNTKYIFRFLYNIYSLS